MVRARCRSHPPIGGPRRGTMRYLNARSSKADIARTGPAASDLDEVKAGLRSLQAHCLTNLAGGLDAMASGDLTVSVTPATAPIARRPEDPEAAELVDLFNVMLGTAQAALASYEALREDLRVALGDRSTLVPLQERLTSLSDNCLVALGKGLAATTRGDLTREAIP